MERPTTERRVVDASEFGELVVKDLDEMVKKLFPNLHEGTIDLAMPFKVSVASDGGTCTCHQVCTEMPDGGTECVEVCTGTGC